MEHASTPDELAVLAQVIEGWAQTQLDENPVVQAAERDADPDVARWFIRVAGEEKDVFSIWLHLRQRNLHYETFVMPAPEENHAQFFEHLLRRNHQMEGANFEIGDEDAIFLAGSLPNHAIDDDELDRILGSLYVWTEQFFKPALRIGYASKFGAHPPE